MSLETSLLLSIVVIVSLILIFAIIILKNIYVILSSFNMESEPLMEMRFGNILAKKTR